MLIGSALVLVVMTVLVLRVPGIADFRDPRPAA